MSLPRKMMNSYVSLRGGMCFGTALSSVPKERTAAQYEEEDMNKKIKEHRNLLPIQSRVFL